MGRDGKAYRVLGTVWDSTESHLARDGVRRTVGMCAVSFDQPRVLASEERALLTTLSGLMARALERARLFDAQHARAQALQRDLLAGSLDEFPVDEGRSGAGQGDEVGRVDGAPAVLS